MGSFLFIVLVIVAPLTGAAIFFYLKSSFILLELVQQDEALWNSLGSPRKVYIRQGPGGKAAGHGGFHTIQPIGPWLSWVWKGKTNSDDFLLVRQLEKTNKLLQTGLFLFVITVAVVLTLILSAPSSSKSNAKQENFNDYSYSGLAGKTYGPNALGVPTGLEEFSGSFVWVDYAAPWCSPCTPQSQVIKAVSNSGFSDVVFLTVLTSGHNSDTPATQKTAQDWAARFGLNPAHVVAEGISERTIPQHALFSPMGQLLYRNSASLSAEEIISILQEKKVRWENWKLKLHEN